MTTGIYLRAKPRINVLRGFQGNTPLSLTQRATPKVGEGIKSGMLITLDSDGKWIKCSNASEALGLNKPCYFAYADQDATDVVSSGSLLGLDCRGQYELQTGYFVASPTPAYADGVMVGKSSTAGSVTTVANGSNGINTAEIVGYCTRGGLTNIKASNSEATPDGNGDVYVLNLVVGWQKAKA